MFMIKVYDDGGMVVNLRSNNLRKALAEMGKILTVKYRQKF